MDRLDQSGKNATGTVAEGAGLVTGALPDPAMVVAGTEVTVAESGVCSTAPEPQETCTNEMASKVIAGRSAMSKYRIAREIQRVVMAGTEESKWPTTRTESRSPSGSPTADQTTLLSSHRVCGQMARS